MKDDSRSCGAGSKSENEEAEGKLEEECNNELSMELVVEIGAEVGNGELICNGSDESGATSDKASWDGKSEDEGADLWSSVDKKDESV